MHKTATTQSNLDDRILELTLLQGNRFLKELLRSRDLPIGRNKSDFEDHLRGGLESGALTSADLEDWLNEIEGWGNQHVFPYEAPPVEPAGLTDPSTFVERLRAAGLAHLFEADVPADPGDEPVLASIRQDKNGISFIWIQGSEKLIRRQELDEQREVDGEDIVFHAYARRWSRISARFDWDFELGLAAVSLARSEDKDYPKQRNLVLSTVDAVLPERKAWPAVNVSRAIAAIDTAALNSATGLKVNAATFHGTAATVRMAATSETGSYQDDAGVRAVRRAVDPSRLVGSTGDFHLTPVISNDTGDQLRPLHLRLYREDDRLLLWGKMTAAEAWGVMAEVRRFASSD